MQLPTAHRIDLLVVARLWLRPIRPTKPVASHGPLRAPAVEVIRPLTSCFRIVRRVPNDTIDSMTLGMPHVEAVLLSDRNLLSGSKCVWDRDWTPWASIPDG
jgi:hypothetical protein